MQKAGRSAGHTTRTKTGCNLALAAPQEPSVCLPPDPAPHSWGQSQSPSQPSGGFEAQMYGSPLVMTQEALPYCANDSNIQKKRKKDYDQ